MKFSKIVINYIVKYLSAFLLIFSTSVVIFQTAKIRIEDYIVTQTHMQIQKGATAVAEMVDRMSLISQLLYADDDFQTLLWEKEPTSQQTLLTMRSANDLLYQVSYMANYIPYMFVLFDRNDVFLSNGQCTKSFSDYYGTFLSVTLSGEEFKEADRLKTFLFGSYKQYQPFQKLESFRYTKRATFSLEQTELNDALIYLTHGDNTTFSSSHIFGFVMSKEQLVESILAPNMLEDSFLYILDRSSKEEFLSYGNVPEQIKSAAANADPIALHTVEDYYSTELLLNYPNWQIITGFSASYINAQLMPVQRVLMIYLVLGLLAVILLTLGLSLSRYYNFHQVFQTIPKEEMIIPDHNRFNEYKFLSHNIANLEAKRKEFNVQAELLKRQNQAILLENMITRSDYVHQDSEFFEELLGKNPEFYCVVLARFFHPPAEHNFQKATFDMLEFLTSRKIPLLKNVHSGRFDELFIIELSQLQEQNTRWLVPVWKEMAEWLSEKYNCILHVGISTVGTCFSNINVCYEQAKRIVQSLALYENETLVQPYDITTDSLHEIPMTTEFLNRLHTILLCGQCENAKEELQRLKGFYTRMPYLWEPQKELCFYSLKNLFYTVMLYLNCPDIGNHMPEFTHSISCAEVIEAFVESTTYICDYISLQKRSNSENLSKRILEFLQDNYQNANLSLSFVSKEVGISENYICQLLKNETGDTFSTHLLQIRLKNALIYLEETDYTNKEIAVLTGFASTNTFYRNFQKVIGISPKAYKERLHMEESKKPAEMRKKG